MKKKIDEPIKIQTYDDLKNIVGFHPCQKISFLCEKCGKSVIKSLSAVKKSGLFCTKCKRDINGIEKYGSEAKFKEHLKGVRQKIISNLIEKYGSYEEVLNHRKEEYKKTCLEKYGVDNTSKLDAHRDFLKKNNPMFNEDIKEKAKRSYTKEKHINASKKTADYMKKNDLYKINVKKCAETKLNKYGDSGFTNHEQGEMTMMSKYGVKSGFNIAVNKKISEIDTDGYVRISDLSKQYDYYEEGVVLLLENLGLKIKKYGSWRCVLKGEVPENFDEIINKQKYSFRSNGEIEMFEYVKSIDDCVVNNDRTVLNPKELDILIPNKNVAIEFDGLFWHKDANLLEKTILCEEKGIKLLHFYEDEWEYKKEICKSIISSSLGVFKNRIYGRKCTVSELSHDEYNSFLNDNHIQGSINSQIRIGLFYENELVQCIGVGKSRFSNDEYELYRMCTKLHTQIIGGFSKLLSYLVKEYEINALYSYVDRRLFNGDGYRKVGFSIVKETKPSYFYFKRLKRENRMKYQKHKLKKMFDNFDDSLTEFENMENNGFSRIYDCGTLKMKINLKMNE